MEKGSRKAIKTVVLQRRLLLLNVVQFVCMIGFGIDFVIEFPGLQGWRHLSLNAALHLGSETLVLVLLVAGFALARASMRDLQQNRVALEVQLRSLRGEFDRILHDRFDRWNLTPAQRDVALMTLRGLRLSEIAGLRDCAEGTVKAHLSAVFRAAEVRTRSELVGLFMDEFIDFGSHPKPRAV